MGLKIKKSKENCFKTILSYLSIYIFLLLLISLAFIGLLINNLLELNRLSLKNVDFLKLKDDLFFEKDISVRRSIARCTFSTCFNVYKCRQTDDEIIKVYVYPDYKYLDADGNTISLTYSKEFLQIIDSIKQSQYYTENLTDACLLVPFVDTLNFERTDTELLFQVLKSLPRWEGGQNHLVFNMIPGLESHLLKHLRDTSSMALVAGAGLSTWLYRDTHDVSIPFYNHVTLSTLDPSRSKRLNRKWLLISSRMDHQAKHLQGLLSINSHSSHHHHHHDDDQQIDQQHHQQQQQQNHNDLLSLKSCKHAVFLQRCDDKYTVYNYPRILQQGTFSLVLEGTRGRLDDGLLLESMAAGAIPVVLVDPLVLPFSSIIDWSRASVVLQENQLSSLMKILSSISREKIREMHRQVLFLYKKYFSSINAITLTSLRIINDRLYPNNVPSYEENNDLRPKMQAPIFLPVTIPRTQTFTAVILTYDRLRSLHTLILQLSGLPSLSKIIVVWNNQESPPPHADQWPQLSKPLKVIQTTANKLSNRFYPYKEIETEAVFSLDDDILTLTNDEIEFAFQTWCEYPDRIVGFPSRLHVYDKRTKAWRYESEWLSSISMVLTAAAFYHKHYNYLYTTSLPEGLLDWVDERMNCEDILFNFMVAHRSSKPPIKVTPRQRFKCGNCTSHPMPVVLDERMVERSYCINYFVGAFNLTKPPLLAVEYRADPLLFKRIFPPSEFRTFNDIGDL